MALCPEFEYRQSLTDTEFWAHIFQTDVPESDFDGPDFDGPDLDGPDLPMSCPVCGELTACGYDSEGRPMIHTFPEESWS